MSDKKWIHCCSCESEWLWGSMESFDENKRCPYCDTKGQLQHCEVDNCPNCAMGLPKALTHLSNLVMAMAAAEDKHYPKAMKVVSDTVENLISQRDTFERQLGLQIKLNGVIKQHIADSAETIRNDIIQAIETLENGDIGGAIGQLRGLVPASD